MKCWRYANFCPILDEGQDHLSCAFSTTLQRISWDDFGQKLTNSIESNNEWCISQLQEYCTNDNNINNNNNSCKIKEMNFIANISSSFGWFSF